LLHDNVRRGGFGIDPAIAESLIEVLEGMQLLWILIAVVVLLLLFGGVGYGYRGSWGGYYGGGVSLLFLILIIVFVIWAIGGFA